MCMETFNGGHRKPMFLGCRGGHGVCLDCVPALQDKWAAQKQRYLAALEVPELERSVDQKRAADWAHKHHADKTGWLECPMCKISVTGELDVNRPLLAIIDAQSEKDELEKQQQVQGFGLKASIKNVLYVRPRPQTMILSCCSWHLCCSFPWHLRGS